jgi:YVTN family beta-propeller protein
VRVARAAVWLLLAGAALASGRASAAASGLYYYTVQLAQGTYPEAVLFDGNHIWVAAEQGSGGVLVELSLTGQVMNNNIPLGAGPIEMAFDGTNIWVTNYTSSTITIVSPAGKILNTIGLGPKALPEGILFDGTYMWVANNGVGVNTVSKFRASSMSLVASYPVGASPDGFAFDGTYIWVTNSLSNTVMKLNRATGAVLRTYPTGEFPLSMVFDGNNVWIGNGADEGASLPPLAAASITELRAYGGAPLGTFPAGNAVRGLSFDGSAIWACNSLGNSVTIIGTSGQPMGTYPTGKMPRGIAYDGLQMWIANSSEHFLTVITPQSTPIQVSAGMGTLIQPTVITPQPLLPMPNSLNASNSSAQSRPSIQAVSSVLNLLLD